MKQAGFTLLELIISLGVSALVGALAAPALICLSKHYFKEKAEYLLLTDSLQFEELIADSIRSNPLLAIPSFAHQERRLDLLSLDLVFVAWFDQQGDCYHTTDSPYSFEFVLAVFVERFEVARMSRPDKSTSPFSKGNCQKLNFSKVALADSYIDELSEFSGQSPPLLIGLKDIFSLELDENKTVRRKSLVKRENQPLIYNIDSLTYSFDKESSALGLTLVRGSLKEHRVLFVPPKVGSHLVLL